MLYTVNDQRYIISIFNPNYLQIPVHDTLICVSFLTIVYLFLILEKAMQHVAMFLRSVPNWEIVEPLPDIGKIVISGY